MSVCFCEDIYVKTFDETNNYPLKTRKCKVYDGPNDFSIFMNQLFIFLSSLFPLSIILIYHYTYRLIFLNYYLIYLNYPLYLNLIHIISSHLFYLFH